jgi:opacity protein-like surface antigen
MGSVRIAALAAVAAVVITYGTAAAADYPCQPSYPNAPVPPHCMTPPPPPPPPVIEEFGGWYIRGDIGMTNQAVGSLDNALFATATGLRIIDTNFESGMLFGLGVGYKWNSWLRFDVTGEYRGETGFHGLDVYTDGGPRFNNYTAKKSEWLYLANIYADLGTWSGVTPFVGAGIGVARIGIHSFRDMGTDGTNVTLGYAESDYKWNIAYALHAGLAYEVTKNFTVELAYRYVYLGTGQSGDIIAYDGTNAIRNPMIFRDIDSHDLKLGVRYLFASAPQQSYQVQQVFQPLMRRF